MTWDRTGLPDRMRMLMAPRLPEWFNPLDDDPVSGGFYDPAREGTEVCYASKEELEREAAEIAAASRSGALSVDEALAQRSPALEERLVLKRHEIDLPRSEPLNRDASATELAWAWALPEQCSPGWEHVSHNEGQTVLGSEALNMLAEARARRPAEMYEDAATSRQVGDPTAVKTTVCGTGSVAALRPVTSLDELVSVVRAHFMPSGDEPWTCGRCVRKRVNCAARAVLVLGRAHYIFAEQVCHVCRAAIDANAARQGSVMSWVTPADVFGLPVPE